MQKLSIFASTWAGARGDRVVIADPSENEAKSSSRDAQTTEGGQQSITLIHVLSGLRPCIGAEHNVSSGHQAASAFVPTRS